MGPTPWWVTLLVGALTVSSSFLAARIGSNRAVEATVQRERAAAREEWFRRVQWATELTLSPDPVRQATGLAILTGLADSALASPDDLVMLRSLNITNPRLNELEGDYAGDVDDTEFFADDEEQQDAIDHQEDEQ